MLRINPRVICTPVAAPVNDVNRPGLIGITCGVSVVKVNRSPVVVSSSLLYKFWSSVVESLWQIRPVNWVVSGTANFDAGNLRRERDTAFLRGLVDVILIRVVIPTIINSLFW